MFSRSDTPDDSIEDETEKQRNPLILAGLAGLLAVAGAFLLVWYLRGDTSSDVADDTPVGAETRSVLVITQPISAGTTIQDLLAAPNSYLIAENFAVDKVQQSAITTIPELQQLPTTLQLRSDAFVGQQLLQDMFIDRATFDNQSTTAAIAQVPPPPGHHLVLLPINTRNALGSNLGPGDNISIIGNFLVRNPEQGGNVQVSVVVLPTVEVVTAQITTEIQGNIGDNTTELGNATIGELAITVAVEPDELTQLTFAMEFGVSVMVAAAIEDADRDDVRPATTIDTILAGAELVTEDLSGLLGLDLVSITDEFDEEDPTINPGDEDAPTTPEDDEEDQ